MENKLGYKFSAGAGIAIYHKGQTWEYHKAMGDTEILYAEQFALAQIFPLLDKLKLDKRNKRIMICTDNDASFTSIYSNHKIPTFPMLMTSIKAHVFDPRYQVIVCKVKSHLEDDSIIGNDCADECAKRGSIASAIIWSEVPTDPLDFDMSVCVHYPDKVHKMLLWDYIGVVTR